MIHLPETMSENIQLQNNVDLRQFTTFKIGGPADYFYLATDITGLKNALQWAVQNKQKVLALGGGSNLIFPDEGFRGLVIKLDFQKLEIKDDKVTVGAGVMLAHLIAETLKHGLIGLEFAAGIPGSVGGAIRGNAGTYGKDMSGIISTITYLIPASGEIKTCIGKDCNFAYRHSSFKENDYIIAEAELQLLKGDVAASQTIIDNWLLKRRTEHPTEPSAGCIFKNIKFEDVDIEKLKTKDLDLDKFAKYQKIPAAYLIDLLGLKGQTIGGAQISPKHGNYIINTGSATAKDVVTLISLIKQQVRDTYGIQLQEEVQIVYN